jgi:hypothetical protein
MRPARHWPAESSYRHAQRATAPPLRVTSEGRQGTREALQFGFQVSPAKWENRSGEEGYTHHNFATGRMTTDELLAQRKDVEGVAFT